MEPVQLTALERFADSLGVSTDCILAMLQFAAESVHELPETFGDRIVCDEAERVYLTLVGETV